MLLFCHAYKDETIFILFFKDSQATLAEYMRSVGEDRDKRWVM